MLRKKLSALVCLTMIFTACNSGDNITTTTEIQEESTMTTTTTTTAAEEEIKPEVTLSRPGGDFKFDDNAAPTYSNASVHDPSIIRVGDTFYVYGSHMASAKTNDLMNWTTISTGPQKGNKLVPDPAEEMAEAFEYAETKTFWAGDVQEMPNGKFYMYYCNCEGSKPLGCIGLAIADNPEGPYENQGIFLKSGMNGRSPDGTNYNANNHPNAIDPHVFFDKNGELWMVYGSYSGGIYILQMDTETGLPIEGQGYGKKLLGRNHSRIEGPYILYSPESDYYYLFLSFGGLDSNGGYNMRVCRSKNPDGPYEDAKGNDMFLCGGKTGSFFDDKSIEPFGVKIMGNYQFKHIDGEAGRTTAYKSPGHNSAYFDEESGKYYLIFHTRFGSGEGHEIRVHEMFLNSDDWFTVAPIRYDGGEIRSFEKEQLVGTYKVIEHGTDITDKIKYSVNVDFLADGTAVGEKNGTWSLGDDGKTATIILDDVQYNGVFLRQYDNDNSAWTMTFTALSADGLALWGCGITTS